MSYRTVEDRTQGNPHAERLAALSAEFQVFDDRLQKALAHKESFSEKVLAKVTGDYRTKLDEILQERSGLETQLRAELQSFQSMLEAIIPIRSQIQEQLEELELRHITGEITTKEYTKRKASIDAQKPEGFDEVELIERNVGYYHQLLNGAASADAAGDEAYLAESFESEPALARDASSTLDEPVDTFAEPIEQTPEELVDEAWTPEPADVDRAVDELYSHAPDGAPATWDADAAPVDEDYADPQEATAAIDASFAEDELAHSSYHPVAELAQDEDALAAESDLEPQSEEEFFEQEFAEAPDPDAAEAWDSGAPAEYSAAREEAVDQALEELDEFTEQDELAEEDLEIPEELLLDEQDSYLETEMPEDDSAALLQSTERLLDEEQYDEVFDDEVDLQSPERTLEPAVVLREGTADEKIFYMTTNVLSIGRGPDNDIQLSTDTSVSRHHSRITYEDDEYWIADLGSSNGTIVNGARVTKTILTGDDEISIGQTALRFKFC